MSDKVKVLHIIKSLGRGGAEILLAETMAKHSAKFSFDVVYFLPWKNQVVPLLEKKGATVYCLSASNTVIMLFRIPKLARLIKKNEYNLVHCHLPWAGIVGRIAARLAGVKNVYTEHNTLYRYNKFTRFFHLLFFGWQDFVITVSEDAEKSLRDNVKTSVPIRTVLNGVDTKSFNRKLFQSTTLRTELKLPVDKKIVTTVAVFRKQKRLDRWLKIAKELVDRKSNVHFIIIGDGPLKDDLVMLCNELRLSPFVTFTGLLDDPRPYLARTDVYLMSSDFEGLPVALMEAMSMECVPVVTPVGGISKLVENEQCGFWFDPNNITEAAEKIEGVVRDKIRLATLGERARARIVNNFDITKMTLSLENIYLQVLNQTK